MALTKISRGLLDTGVSDSSDATAITIDSSENVQFAGNVGIGVAPTHNFNLSSAGAVEARFTSTDNDCYLQIASDTDEGQDSVLQFLSGTSARGSITYDHNTTAASQNMIFKTGDNAVNAMQITGDGELLVNQTSNNTNAKVNIGASNGIPLTIGSDQYGGSGTVTFFTESIEGKTASNTHTITISFASQGSRWATHLAEIHFAGSRDNATTVLCGRALYSFATLTGFSNIGELEDIGTNVTMNANDSGMDLVITVSASTVATYQVMVKVISSFGNARPYAITCT